MTGEKLRMTQQRQVILDELRKVNTHPTADEIYQTVRHRLSRISLGTVYRNLDVLSENGLIRKIDFCGAQMRFDGDLSEHYHVRCLRCGRVGDLLTGPIAGLNDLDVGAADYDIIGYRLEFVGICAACRG